MMRVKDLLLIFIGIQTAVRTVEGIYHSVPYFASIEKDGKYICSGTIVDDFWVMAPNSTIGAVDPYSLTVRVGTNACCWRGQVVKVIEFSPIKNTDFSLLKVAAPFTFTDKTMWVNLNVDGIKENQNGLLMGWADKEKRGSPLIASEMTVMSSDSCMAAYDGVMNITRDMFCVTINDPSTNLSPDMGAPLYYNEQLYGMLTHDPDNSTLPYVITQISQYTSFVIMAFCEVASFF